MTLKYSIQFFDYWHLSSGLSGGAKLDSSVIKDQNDLPYVSGKTIKGSLREIAQQIDCQFTNECFGGSSDEKDRCYDKNQKNISGICYFSNAILDEKLAKQIVAHKLQDNLYDTIASTKIDDRGVAYDKSLREVEVVIPLRLYGEISDIPDEYREDMQRALKAMKRMGLSRARGLGRCQFEEVQNG